MYCISCNRPLTPRYRCVHCYPPGKNLPPERPGLVVRVVAEKGKYPMPEFKEPSRWVPPTPGCGEIRRVER